MTGLVPPVRPNRIVVTGHQRVSTVACVAFALALAVAGCGAEEPVSPPTATATPPRSPAPAPGRTIGDSGTADTHRGDRDRDTNPRPLENP